MTSRNVSGTHRFPKRARLRKRSEFLAVQNGAVTKLHGRHFLVLITPRHHAETGGRVGITVSKKVGCAVVRNRIRRLVRELVRRSPERWLATGNDIVIIAKRSAADLAGLADVEADLGPIGRRLARC